jgi:hypothetical protein
MDRTRTINAPPNCTTPLRMAIGLRSSKEKRITRRDTSIRGRLLSTRKTPMSIVTRRKTDMASPRSDMMTSRLWLTSSGEREDVRKDRRMKIGFVPRKNCGRALASNDALQDLQL